MKFFGLLKKGRRLFFTLALFVLVFAVASIVKVQAADFITGWLWGGGAEPDDSAPYDGTNTNAGWISMSNTNPGAGGSISYGVQIESGGKLSGYAWGENIGWVSFDEADLAGCPSGICSARREDDYLKGWARIVAIKDAYAAGNSGGWEGWISLDDKTGSSYGVQISKMDGTGNNPTYAWSASSSGLGELGWIDFSRAQIETCENPGCATKMLCTGDKFTTCDSSFCTNGGTCALTGDTTWTCSNACGSASCSAFIESKEDGVCGPTDGQALCQGQVPTNEDLCDSGTPSPSASSLDVSGYEVIWQCVGSCGGVTVDCSAHGKRSCGWIETNP